MKKSLSKVSNEKDLRMILLIVINITTMAIAFLDYYICDVSGIAAIFFAAAAFVLVLKLDEWGSLIEYGNRYVLTASAGLYLFGQVSDFIACKAATDYTTGIEIGHPLAAIFVVIGELVQFVLLLDDLLS